MKPTEFLSQYPLDSETQEIIDRANRGDTTQLVSILTSSLRAVSALGVSTPGMTPQSVVGLRRYYQAKIRAYIALVKNSDTRKSLRKIFIGEDR